MKKLDVICIVDDDEIFQFTTKYHIEFSGFANNVVAFPNGEEALEYLVSSLDDNEKVPDLILLDINMPIMDGWDFLEEYVKIKPKLTKPVHIYMVSSSIDDRDIKKAKNISEVSDYVIKPVDEIKLQEMFDKMTSL